MPTLIAGTQLDSRQRQQVLAAFIYRWTSGNTRRTHVWKCTLCDIKTPYENSTTANGHTHPTIPLQTDEQWISAHAFYVNKNGQWSKKPDYCEPISMLTEKEN